MVLTDEQTRSGDITIPCQSNIYVIKQRTYRKRDQESMKSSKHRHQWEKYIKHNKTFVR